MLQLSVITSLQGDTYVDKLLGIFLKLSMKNSTNAFNYWDDFSNEDRLSTNLTYKTPEILHNFHIL